MSYISRSKCGTLLDFSCNLSLSCVLKNPYALLAALLNVPTPVDMASFPAKNHSAMSDNYTFT